MRTQLTYLILGLSLTGIFSCEMNKKKPVVTSEKNQDSVTSPNTNPFSVIDQSPMDMSYFPASYPLMKMEGKAPSLPVMRIIYSRPHRKGREIFGDDEKSLCRYGKEWRLGANEATEIEFFRDVSLKGNKLSKGRYIMYCKCILCKSGTW